MTTWDPRNLRRSGPGTCTTNSGFDANVGVLKLLRTQIPRVRRRRHRRQRLQRPGGFEGLAHRALRHPIPAGHRHIDLTPLVEDAHHREFLDPGLALHPHQLLTPRH